MFVVFNSVYRNSSASRRLGSFPHPSTTTNTTTNTTTTTTTLKSCDDNFYFLRKQSVHSK